MDLKCKLDLLTSNHKFCELKENHYEFIRKGVEFEIPDIYNFYGIVYLFKIGARFSMFFLFIILLANPSPLYSQNKFSFSGGISNKWTVNPYEQSAEGQPDVISVGGTAYFASLGYFWRNDNEDKFGENSEFRITVEKFNSQLQNWKKIPIGSVDANIFRFDPLVSQGRIGNSNVVCKFSVFGISIYTGKGNLLPHSFCWDDHSWHLIEQLNIKSTIGWSLGDLEIGYKIFPHVQLGIETVLIEADKFKVIFQANNKKITSDVFESYGLLPLKLRFTINI